MKSQCPNCGVSVNITVTLQSPTGVEPTSPTHLAVRDYVRLVGPKLDTSTALYHDYTIRAADNGWPDITHNNFSRLIKLLGAASKRQATARYYQLPDLTEPTSVPHPPLEVDEKPPPARPSPAALADLPFTIDYDG